MATRDMITEYPVVIIGAGVVGLSASLFLSSQGFRPLLIERHSGTSIHPRARSVNSRTMEIFRQLGLDELVRDAGASIAPSMGIYTGTSLEDTIGSKPRRKAMKKFPFSGLAESIGPVSGAWVTQDMLEPVLLNSTKERGTDVRFHTDCITVEQTEDSVIATLRDRGTGTVSTVRASFLIAADGAKSPIRSQLNVPTTGRGTMGHLLNILFRADLEAFVQHREFSLCIIRNARVSGLFASINNKDRWVFQLAYDPAKGENASDFTPEKCQDLLRIALGMPDIPIEIISMLPWEPTVRVAEQVRYGRIFLAGDSAHVMPPWAGQGANSGISDVHNLSWKLAAVLRGEANDSLLETYQQERLPVGREAAEASAAGATEKGMISTERNLTVIRGWLRKLPLISGHGYSYSSGAICYENTYPLGGVTWRPWTLPSLFFAIDGRPGRRVPHVWVVQDGKRISTLDVVGNSFVLLTGVNGEPWKRAAERISSVLKVNLTTYRVGPDGDLVTLGREFEVAAGISSHGAVLVRPDGFVTMRWRYQGSLVIELEHAMKQTLGLD